MAASVCSSFRTSTSWWSPRPATMGVRARAMPRSSSCAISWFQRFAIERLLVEMSELGLAVFIAAVFLLAGGIKGVLGLGLPTVGMGLLSVVMPPAQAAG